MIFLVRSTIRNGSIEHPDWARLLEQERVEGRALHANGKVRHVWRVPGRYEAVTIFDVASTEELDKILWSLPLWRFMDIHVEPLAAHYYDDPEGSRFEDIAPSPVTRRDRPRP
jgi:muconolactone D-isomerase